jgi:DNA topoisomerase-1
LKQEADANRTITDFGADGDGIQVLNGRYGPYVTNGKKNAKIPKDRDPKSLTLEECRVLIEQAPERGAGRFGRGKRGKQAAAGNGKAAGVNGRASANSKNGRAARAGANGAGVGGAGASANGEKPAKAKRPRPSAPATTASAASAKPTAVKKTAGDKPAAKKAAGKKEASSKAHSGGKAQSAAPVAAKAAKPPASPSRGEK